MLGDGDTAHSFGTMTSSIYDTAWVALVSKTVARSPQWLFPSSFLYVLKAQSADGAWPAHLSQECVDDSGALLSTLAALYCLIQHQKTPFQLQHFHGSNGLSKRIEKAKRRIDQLFQVGILDACTAVGFEILVPSLLELLEAEHVSFRFPGRDALFALRDKKLAKIPPVLLYQRAPTALLHSLEAFHGHRDFDYGKIARHKVNGSLMASPSATASYLICCEKWDDEAEAYLRLAISNGAGLCSGAVPSAYPSSSFEMLWVRNHLNNFPPGLS